MTRQQSQGIVRRPAAKERRGLRVKGVAQPATRVFRVFQWRLQDVVRLIVKLQFEGVQGHVVGDYLPHLYNALVFVLDGDGET